ncbi:hypothetical protein D7Y09_10725 [bacterium 1XD42-1]|nr:hypothetical protein D7X25_19310 [bacterium 1XD42-8]RKJ63751.1 hypothetical protein D7Y09_10725 [bacterium 1XD42-1]
MQGEKGMAETITGIKIKNLVEEGKIIENGSISNCGALKYDFTLSDEILKSDFSTPIKFDELSVEERRKALIQPGEVVYVLTKEKVNLPSNMYMSLSANRGMSEYGVLTLGGFAVDPGYSGRLMFGLYNYSSTPFTLIPNSKLIGGIFYQLSENEVIDTELMERPKPIDAFPARLVSIISKYSPTGMSSLDESIKAISKQMEALKEDFNKNKDELFSLRHLVQDTQEQTNRTSRTVQDLSSNVAELTNSVKDLKLEVSDLKDVLKDEIKLRQDMRGDLEKQIELVTKSVDRKLIFLKGALWTLSALVGVLGTLLTCWANGWLKFGG